MKKIILFIINIIIFTTTNLWSQNVQTDTLKVEGNCNMCKARIERAAFIKGVISAKWYPETKLLIVQYKPSKVNRAAIEKSILNAGHDLEDKKAEDKAYEKLHSCCKYRDKKE